MRLKKMENEIKKLQEMVRKRTTEKEEADRRAEDFEGLLNDSNRRMSERELELQADLRSKGIEIEGLRSDIERANARLKKSTEDLAARDHSSKAADSNKLKELSEVQQKLEAMRLSMQSQIDSLRSEGKQLRDAGDAAERKFSAASREAAAKSERMREEMDSMRADQVRVKDERDRLENEVKSRDEMLNDWKTRIEQCRKYIVKICQPSFTVVKDESLTPMGQDDKDGGGFVLVPLSLMLEGYTLLPPDMKKKIADDYESAKAKKALDALTEDFVVNQPRKPVPTSSFSLRAKK
jgi:chromosome segregation ATPase